MIQLSSICTRGQRSARNISWDGMGVRRLTSEQLGSIAHAVLFTISLNFGFGRHSWDIRAFSLTPDRLHVSPFKPTMSRC
ncbi:hypothetical protein BDV95DRAFT_570119 [Massariosphaeria phaeospora]|uniref:Uncharacterized protein n=1 Tax=Massariosphaeria phaeospora TaxID=100035 RepID=A0A7C8MA10_9PLEO|nr:hypothetical protein BDV95DRAFT_570119 [Massariosphaeria phaeospora]